jgi:tetratricopeptide (TPR) repeat protein
MLLLVLVGVSCSRDPAVVSRKYLQNGNRYFDKGKYKEAFIMYRNALKKDPRYSEAYYRVGLTELKLGRPGDAARDLRRANDTDPKNQDSRAQLGDIYLVVYLSHSPGWQNLGADIKKLADELLALNPKSVPGLRLKGYYTLAVERKPKEAIAVFQQANQISPLRPDIVLPLAQSLIADGQAAEAEKICREMIAKDKTVAGIYDLLYIYYLQTNRPADAEAVLKQKVANNPGQTDFQLQLARYYYATQRRNEMAAVLDSVSSHAKDYPGAREKLGKFYFAIRDFDNASRQFDLGAAENPKDKAGFQKMRAEVLVAQNKKQEAASLLEELLKDNPKDDEAQALRASLLIETGDPKQVQAAIDRLQDTVRQEPDNVVMRFNLGRAFLAKSQVDPNRAQSYVDQARLQFVEASKRQKDYVPPRLALGQIQMLRREYSNALQTANEILQIEPSNLNARLMQTTAMANMGNRDQARQALLGTIKEFPNSREAVIQLALLDLGENRFKDAQETFLKLYQTNPADLRGLMGLTEAYAAEKQFDKAIQLLRTELTKNPSRTQLHVAIGNIAFRSGNYDLAISEFQTYAQANPKSGDTLVRLGAAYIRKADYPDAVKAFQQARQLRPNDVEPALQLALVYETMGQKTLARPLYEEILKLQPDNAIALNNLAYIMAEGGGDLDQALSLAQRAKDRLPEDPNVSDTLGWIYIKKNLSDNAVKIFRTLVAAQPENSTYRYHLGMALYQKGDRPEAKKVLQSALEKKPSKEEAARIRELMAKLG